MTPNKFIEATPPNPRQHAAGILVSGGWSHSEAEWLVPVLFQALGLFEAETEALLEERAEHAFKEFALARHQLDDAACAIAYATHFVEKLLNPPVPEEHWNVALKAAHSQGVDLLRGLAGLHGLVLQEAVPSLIRSWVTSGPQESALTLQSLGRRYFEAGVADIAPFVRWGSSPDPDGGDGWAPTNWPTAARLARIVDPREMSFWLHAVGDSAVVHLADHVALTPGAERIERASCLVRAVSDWMTSKSVGGLELVWFDFRDLPEAVRAAAERLYFSIQSELAQETKDHSHAMALSLRLARMAFEYRSNHLSIETRKILLRIASDSISKLRPLLWQAHTPEAASEFSGHPTASIRDDAIYMLFEFGSLWEAWKPLLLAFRALSAPSLSPELSFHQSAPHPWNIIPSSVVMMFHHRARLEQDKEPSLKSLRSEFGQFCLDSLKTHRKRRAKNDLIGSGNDAASLREPSAEWRFAYIRALLELRINPGGDGHRVLRWVADKDPDEGVRVAAQKAYNEVRRGERLGDMSPRRALLQAFWWLEQAHMLALGQDVNGPGAQRTREWMVRMTTEKSPTDRQENL